jgi:hypothetical protein
MPAPNVIAIVKEVGQPIPTVIAQYLGPLTEVHTKLLAEEHKKELDKAIEDSRDRVLKPTGNHLKDQIQVEKISAGEQNGYGVGNVEVLNQKAPWWVWINFGRAGTGRTIPPGTKDNPKITGHFIPENKGIFTKGQPKFPMNPKRAIKAHNYIERSLGIMLGKIRELLK